MNTFETLIFIPEGTLLNEKLALKNALKSTLKKHEIDFKDKEAVYAKLRSQFKFLSEDEQINLILQTFLANIPETKNEYLITLSRQHRLIKGSFDFLDQVKDEIKLLCWGKTKKDILEPRLADSNLLNYFDSIQYNIDFKKSFNIRKQLHELNIDPDSALIIGSNLVEEIQEAENENLSSLWLAPKKDKNPIKPRPTLHLSRLSDLLFYLNV